MRKFWTICVAVLLISLIAGLTSCGAFSQTPPEEAVRIAVTRQLLSAQNAIAQDLGLPTQAQPSFKIDKLTIETRKKISEAAFETKDYPSDVYRVSGTVDTTLTAESGKTQQTGPFEVYLGITPPSEPSESETTETWYLIPPPKA